MSRRCLIKWFVAGAQCLAGWLAAAVAGPELVIQRGHEVEVVAAVYSPDQRIIASAGDSDFIRLWDRASGDLVRVLPGHPERIVGLAFSPDGRWLASSSTDGSVKLWDYREGQLAHLLTNHVGNWARRVAFSPDSRWLTAATYTGGVSVWDVASGAVVRTLLTGERAVDVAFTPNGRHLVTGSREDEAPLIRFWDMTTGKPGLTLNHSNRLHNLAVSRDGRRLAAGGDKGVVNIWELPSGRWLRRIVMPDNRTVNDVDLSPDGRWLATAGHRVNRVWATDSGVLRCEMRGHEDGSVQVGFSADGRELVSGSGDASVRLWDARTGSMKRVFARRPPNTPVTSLAISADGKFEAVGSTDGVVRVWDARDGSFKFDLRGHEGPVHAIGFSRNSAWLFTAGADRMMRVWDLAHGNVSAVHPYFNRDDAIGTLAAGGKQELIASAGGRFASASADSSIKLWRSHFDRPVRVLHGHAANVCALAFAGGHDLLASASVDRTVKLWDARDGQCLRTETNRVLTDTLAFSPDSKWLVAGMSDGSVRVLDTNSLATAREWPAHRGRVQSLVLSSDGRRLATAGADQTVAVWDWETGREVRRFTNITSQFLPLAFRPGQPVLAFAQRDELVVHAHVETGEVLFQRALFPDGEWLAWNPDKAFYMASARGDEHARLRFDRQLQPVYPLGFYRKELRRESDLLAALAAPAPVLMPKDFQLWWHRYPYKRAWLYALMLGCAVAAVHYLQRGWVAERRRRAQTAFARRLLASQEQERKRIAGELHDSLGQDLQIIRNRAVLGLKGNSIPDHAAEQLREISASAARAIGGVRAITHALRPTELDQVGLAKSIEWLVEKSAEGSGVRLTADLDAFERRLPPETEINLYRIVQEALTNLLKHAQATEATVELKRDPAGVRLSIYDNGRGFDPGRPVTRREDLHGLGLAGIAERAAILGGTCDVQSAPGRGTRVTVIVPDAKNPARADQDQT
jgi:WD40 repeat protein/two-component sensor histidine kinase